MDKYIDILEDLSEDQKLVIISKKRSNAEIMEYYDKGHRDFGENRVPELIEKHATLPLDIDWHMVGHLQRNKVKLILPFVNTIHSCDSKRIIKEIDKEAKKNERVVKILLQIKIAEESNKYGWDFGALTEYIQSGEIFNLRNIMIIGVMGMATLTDDKDKIRAEFETLRSYFEVLKENHFGDNFTEISMGMSNDYKIALTSGASIIRIGSLLFED